MSASMAIRLSGVLLKCLPSVSSIIYTLAAVVAVGVVMVWRYKIPSGVMPKRVPYRMDLRLSKPLGRPPYLSLTTCGPVTNRIAAAGAVCFRWFVEVLLPFFHVIDPAVDPRAPAPRGVALDFTPPVAFPSQWTHKVYLWWMGATPMRWGRVTLYLVFSVAFWYYFLYTMMFSWLKEVIRSRFGMTLDQSFANWTALPWFTYRLIEFLYHGNFRYQHALEFPIQDYGVFRTRVRNIVIPSGTVQSVHHSHPLAAAARNNADTAINNFIVLQGFEPYSIQLSARDVTAGLNGSLTHHWDVDTHQPERNDEIRPGHVFKLINVDYYIDWTQYLWMAQPFMLYTFTPKDPCGTHDEVQWTTNPDNTITMSVSGGAKFVHQLWDYNLDMISVTYPGIRLVYSVESVPVNENWSIVLITPKSIAAAPDSAKVECSLKRLKLYHVVDTMGGERRGSAMLRHAGTSAMYSLAIPGTFASVRISVALQTMLHSRTSGIAKLSFSDLVIALGGDFGTDSRLAQAVIWAAYPCSMPMDVSWHTPQVKRDSDIAYRKLASPTLVRAEKFTATVLSPPVIANSFAPVRSRANEFWTLDARLGAVRNEQVKFIPRYVDYAAEFARLLLPREHMLFPVSVSEVIASQNRPSQRRNNAAAAPFLAELVANPEILVKSFQKGEMYPKLADPRNISTLPAGHCLLYSTYTLAFAAHLKKTNWYAFGKHPDAVAQAVHELACRSTTLTETDFSRFDGTHSHALYAMERALLMRAFPTTEHAVLGQVHDAMTSALGRTGTGVSYDPDGSRLSGCADTSCMNSVDNAFVAYCVYRQMGMSELLAYAKLGLYGGDDGISPDADEKAYDTVVSDLGLRLKAVCRPSLEMTTFLGRFYPRPTAAPEHMADPARQLSKLHVTPSRDPAQIPFALYNKAMGHLVTDPDTPVLSEWSHMILRLTPSARKVDVAKLRSYTSIEFGVSRSSPPRAVALGVIAKQLNVTTQRLEDYCTHLRSLTRIEDLQPLVTPAVHMPPPDVVVGNNCGALKPKVSTHCQHGCGDDACEHKASKHMRDLGADQEIKCRWCEATFVYTAKEARRNLAKYDDSMPPKSCFPCREARRAGLPKPRKAKPQSSASPTPPMTPSQRTTIIVPTERKPLVGDYPEDPKVPAAAAAMAPIPKVSISIPVRQGSSADEDAKRGSSSNASTSLSRQAVSPT